METNNPIDALRSAGNEFTFSTDVDSRVPDFAKLSHRRNNRRLLVGAALALGLMIPTAASFLSARDSAPQIAIAEKGKAKKKVTKKKKTVEPSSPVVPVSSNSAAAQELGLSATEVISADQGFRSGRDGFNFANYGGAPTDDAIDATVMVALFGRSNVCANATGSDCVELPGAIDVKNQLNDAMAAGRCEGFATLSQRFFDGIDQRPNGARETGAVARLEVAKQISYWWATQVAPTVASSAKQYRAMAPSGIVAALIKGMAEKSGLTLGLYSSTGGHSISPLAVTKDGANWNIYVYDNNYPKEIRKVVVNGSNETWTYGGASLNSASAGDTWTGTGAGTMDLTPMSARKGPFNVSFGSTKGATKGSVYRVFVTQKPKKKGAVATTPLGAVLQVGEKSVNSSNFVAAGKEPFNARTFMAGSRGVGVVAYIPVTPGPSGDVRVRPTGDPTSGVFAVSMDRPGLPSLYASSSATFTMVGRDGSKSDSITIEGVTAPVYIKTSANGVSHTFSLDKGNKYIVEATATTATFTVLDKSGEAVYEGAIPVNVPKGTVINIDHEFDPITKEWDTTTTNGVAAKIDNYFVENLSVTAPKSKVLTPAVTTTTSTTVPAFNGIELPLRAIANTTTTLPPLQAAPAPTTTVAETTTTTVAPTTTIATTTTTTLAPDAVAVSVAGTRFYGSDDSSIIWKWSCDGSTVGCEWAKAQFDDSKMEVKVSATKSSAASDTPYSGTMSLVDGVSAPSTIKLTTSVSLMVEPRALTVMPDSGQSKVYGEKDDTLTYKTEGLVNSDKLSGDMSREAGEDADTYSFTLGTLENANYKLSIDETAVFTITKANAIVVPDSLTAVYGSTGFDQATGLGYSVTGLVNSDTKSVVSGLFNRVAGSDVKDYDFIISGLTAANYNLALKQVANVDVVFTITKAELTVTPTVKSMTYGDPGSDVYSDLAYKVAGLVKGETESVVTGSLKREEGKIVGSYNFVLTDLAAANYTFRLAQADGNDVVLKIEKRAVTVIPTPLTKNYGEEDPSFTYDVTNLAPDDNESVIKGTLTRMGDENVGFKNFDETSLSATNYTINIASQFEIKRVTLTVSPNTLSKVYGSTDDYTDVPFTVTAAELKNGDTQATAVSGKLTREVGNIVGSYNFVLADLTAANYTLTLAQVDGTDLVFKIEKRAVTVTAKSYTVLASAIPASFEYLAPSPALVSGDTLSYTTLTRSSSSTAAGSYPITQTSQMSHPNYVITFVPGTLTIEAFVPLSFSVMNVNGTGSNTAVTPSGSTYTATNNGTKLQVQVTGGGNGALTWSVGPECTSTTIGSGDTTKEFFKTGSSKSCVVTISKVGVGGYANDSKTFTLAW